MTSCHIVKSSNRTGIIIVLMTLPKSFRLFMVDLSPLTELAFCVVSVIFFSSPKFHIVPRIHKKPMVGRPIAASYSYITSFIDELTKPKIRMPTVLRDSGELIQLLENTVLPNNDCFLVTADIVSLCSNVHTKNEALIALDLLLREARVPETPLLIQLPRLVCQGALMAQW